MDESAVGPHGTSASNSTAKSQAEIARAKAAAGQLPQTGAQDETKTAVAGATIALIGLAGLTGAAKKRRKN